LKFDKSDEYRKKHIEQIIEITDYLLTPDKHKYLTQISA